MIVLPTRAAAKCKSHWPRIAVLLLAAVVHLAAVSSTAAAQPPVTAITISPAGDSVVIGSQAGLTLLDWPDLQVRRIAKSKLPNIHDIAFSPDAQTIAVVGGAPGEHGMIELVAWPSLKPKHTWTATNDLFTSVRWLSATTLAVGGHDHSVSIWNLDSDTPVRQLLGHSRGVTSLAMLPDEQLLVSAGLDNSLRVWDVNTDQSTNAIPLVRSLNIHTQPVLDLALRPSDGGLPAVASASEDRTVRLWQPTIGRMVRFARLDATPLSLAWFPDGSRLAAACTDGRVRIIDPDVVQVTQNVQALDGWAYALAIHPSDLSIVVGGTNGAAKRVEIAANSSSE